MPDQYGFNHLGDNLRCIDCPEGGLIGQWPEHKRARHASTHGNRPKQSGGADVRRQRLLAAGYTVFVVYLVTALIGVAVRLYLTTATAFDYHLLGRKYRIIFPALFVLDMLWALAPFLIADRIGLGLALGSCAALVYMPFAQRVLMKMMEKSS